MPLYRFRATQPSGLVHKGQMIAANENDLVAMLRESGLELIDVQTKNAARFPVLARAPRSRMSAADFVTICRQLRDLLKAGLSFPAALHGIATSLPSGPLRDRLDAIMHNVNQGTAIASAFGQHSESFNNVFLAILKAGETGGDLEATFDQLTRYLERQTRLHDQMHRALRYPLFLLALALSVTLFMLITVVPRVLDFLNSMTIDLPWPTRVLIAVSSFFEANWVFCLAVLLVSIGCFFLARRFSESFVLRSDGWLLTLPGLGPTLHKLALARFANSFALLLQSGADLPSALATAKGVLGNRALIANAEQAEHSVLAGQSLSTATFGLFPPFVIQMLRVGEHSGNLVTTLNHVSSTYDSEAQAAVDQFIGALEPALTLLVGALLAWVVLAVLGPVYGSLGKLSASGVA